MSRYQRDSFKMFRTYIRVLVIYTTQSTGEKQELHDQSLDGGSCK